MSLRAKGLVVFVTFVVYLVAAGYLLSRERMVLLDLVEEIDYVQRFEVQLTQANLMLARTLVLVNDGATMREVENHPAALLVELEAAHTAVDRMEERFPRLIFLSSVLQTLNQQLERAPSRPLLRAVGGTLHELVGELDQVTAEEQKRRADLLATYRTVNDQLIRQGVLYGLIGIIVFGLVIAIFLTRLTFDIEDLRKRALAIVRGYRGRHLAIRRRDELGSLMDSVNTIQETLRARESQIEVERQQRFHREKMAAVGSLAAAVAHEINNPVTAIAGVAEAIQDQCRSAECPNLGKLCKPDLILEQARRVSHITRQLAEFSAPQPLEPQLTDINALVRSTCGFVAFDRRFRGVDLATELDPELPAVTLVADHITQVLMNLLLNAADAVEDKSERRVRVETGREGGGVVIRVMDNGMGMDAKVLSQVFDEFYTTKPVGKGTGLGLAVCKSLIEAMGGRIDLLSADGEGTTASVWLPLTSRHAVEEKDDAYPGHR